MNAIWRIEGAMLKRTCFAAAVALGCILAVSAVTVAADEKDESPIPATEKPTAAAARYG